MSLTFSHADLHDPLANVQHLIAAKEKKVYSNNSIEKIQEQEIVYYRYLTIVDSYQGDMG